MQDRIYDLKRIQLDNKAQHLEASENRERQAEINAITEFNLQDVRIFLKN